MAPIRPEMLDDLIDLFETVGNHQGPDRAAVELPRYQWLQIAELLKKEANS